MFKKNKSINRSIWNIKILKLWQQQIGQLSKKRKDNNKIHMCELSAKWTYKTALGIAQESTDTEVFELICVVETSKILLNNDKKEIQTDEIPIG